MQSKEEIEKAYWKGYIQKQNEAVEICKQCKYIKKVREIESREQKLIEKLEEDKNNLEFSRDLDMDKGFGEDEEDMAVRIYIEEILKILKGENDKKY